VDIVIPATTSTSAALATRAITAPGVPANRPGRRSAHRRAPEADPDCGAGAATGSPSWLRPLSSGVTGWPAMAAAGGSELVTGRKRSPTCRVRGWVDPLKSVHRPDPCRAGPGPPGNWCGFTAAHLPCGFIGHRRPSATLRAQPITLLTRRSLSRPVPLRRVYQYGGQPIVRVDHVVPASKIRCTTASARSR
jgi:hypothetical protein